MEVTEGSRVSWEEMWFVVGFVDQIWMLADGYKCYTKRSFLRAPAAHFEHDQN